MGAAPCLTPRWPALTFMNSTLDSKGLSKRKSKRKFSSMGKSWASCKYINFRKKKEEICVKRKYFSAGTWTWTNFKHNFRFKHVLNVRSVSNASNWSKFEKVNFCRERKCNKNNYALITKLRCWKSGQILEMRIKIVALNMTQKS